MSTVIYDYSSGVLYAKYKTNETSSSLPAPTAAGTEFSAADYVAITTDDTNYAAHGTGSVDNNWVWQIFRFNVSAIPAGLIKSALTVEYTGYGKVTRSPEVDHVDIYVYNFNTTTWDAVGDTSVAVPTLVSKTFRPWGPYSNGTYLYVLARNPYESWGAPDPAVASIHTDYLRIILVFCAIAQIL